MGRLLKLSFIFLLVGLLPVSNLNAWELNDTPLQKENERIRRAYYQIAKARDQRTFPKRYLKDPNVVVRKEARQRYNELPKER